MFNKATDAVSKMTIKMNESDIVSIWMSLGCPCPCCVFPPAHIFGEGCMGSSADNVGSNSGSVPFSGSRRSFRRWSVRSSGYGSCMLL